MVKLYLDENCTLQVEPMVEKCGIELLAFFVKLALKESDLVGRIYNKDWIHQFVVYFTGFIRGRPEKNLLVCPDYENLTVTIKYPEQKKGEK